MNFSFAGCGFLGIYHVGVASCLKQHAHHLVENCQFAGASAGSLVACCLMCGCSLGDCTTFTLRLATKARSFSIGPLHPSFDVAAILRDALDEVLPANAHEIASGRLFVSLTRVTDRESVIVSEFSSKAELIQALLCSAHVPFYSGLVPPSYRGVRYVDGGLSNNIPILNNETVSVSPFAGESDICPSDGSANPLHVMLANTSFQFTMGNLYRMTRALFPPHPEVLSDMCQQGFDDCLKFLQSNNLLSCVRHLSIRSVVAPVRDTTDCENEEEVCEEGHCHDCKTRKRLALVDKLPHAVGSALQEACESVNKGVKAYIYRHRALRLMSFMATPWFLPVDIAYTYAVRFLDFLPHLPQQTRVMCKETSDLLVYLISHLKHTRHRYTARLTCQLAITEVNYNSIDHDIFPSNNEVVLPSANITNVNFQFAVDLDSHMANQSVTFNPPFDQAMDALQPYGTQGYRERSASASAMLRTRSDSSRVVTRPRTNEHDLRNEAFDTFEQCLHVSNEMESALAYHYLDESDGTMRYEEIYPVRNDVDLSRLNESLRQCRNYSASLDNLGKLKRHLDEDIEKFLHKKVHIQRQENELEVLDS